MQVGGRWREAGSLLAPHRRLPAVVDAENPTVRWIMSQTTVYTFDTRIQLCTSLSSHYDRWASHKSLACPSAYGGHEQGQWPWGVAVACWFVAARRRGPSSDATAPCCGASAALHSIEYTRREPLRVVLQLRLHTGGRIFIVYIYVHMCTHSALHWVAYVFPGGIGVRVSNGFSAICLPTYLA